MSKLHSFAVSEGLHRSRRRHGVSCAGPQRLLDPGGNGGGGEVKKTSP